MGELLKPKENMKTGNVWTCDRKDSCQGFCLCYYVTIKQFIEGPQFSGVPNMKQNLFFQILLSAVLCLNSLIVGQQIPKLHGHFKLLKLIQLVKTSLCSFFPSPLHTKKNKSKKKCICIILVMSELSSYLGLVHNLMKQITQQQYSCNKYQ